MKWRFLYILMFLFTGCCVDNANAQRWDNVRFWGRYASFPAREWTLMPVSVKHGSKMKVVFESYDSVSYRSEWMLERPRDLADSAEWCTYLYLPPVAPGRYWLRAVADGDTALACIVRSDEVLVGYNIDNGMPDFRRGFLLDAVSGRPMEGWKVSLKRYFTDWTEALTRTDAMGRYRFEKADSNYHPYVVVCGEQEGAFTWVEEEEPDAEEVENALIYYDKGLADTSLPMPVAMGRTDARLHPNFWHPEGMVFRHSIDSSEFVRCFPQYAMDGEGSNVGMFAASPSCNRAQVGDTLLVEIRTEIAGLTVMCMEMVNGREKKAYTIQFDGSPQTLGLILDEEGVTDVMLLALWHGEMRSQLFRVRVGDRRQAWLASALHQPLYAEMAYHVQFMGSAGYYRKMQQYE